MQVGSKRVVEIMVVRRESRDQRTIGGFIAELEVTFGRDGWEVASAHRVVLADHVEFEATLEREVAKVKASEEAQELRQLIEGANAPCGLTVRVLNCLEGEGIGTVPKLLMKTPRDLLFGIRNFGAKCLEVVREALRLKGLHLKDDSAPETAPQPGIGEGECPIEPHLER